MSIRASKHPSFQDIFNGKERFTKYNKEKTSWSLEN